MKLKFVNKVFFCKFISVFLLFFVGSVKLETIHELKCLSKNCDDLLKKGEVKFSQPETKDFLQVNKDTLVDIFGENENNYFIKINDKQGLIKKNFVVVKQDLSKDRQILVKKVSFENDKILIRTESPLKLMFGKIKTQKLKENNDNQKPIENLNKNIDKPVVKNFDNETNFSKNKSDEKEVVLDEKVTENKTDSEIKVEMNKSFNLNEPVKMNESELKVENQFNLNDSQENDNLNNNFDSNNLKNIPKMENKVQAEKFEESDDNLKKVDNLITNSDISKNNIDQNINKVNDQNLNEKAKKVDENLQDPVMKKDIKPVDNLNLQNVENLNKKPEISTEKTEFIPEIKKNEEEIKEPIMNSQFEIKEETNNVPQENNVDKNQNFVKKSTGIEENLLKPDTNIKFEANKDLSKNNLKPSENQNFEKTPEKLAENKINPEILKPVEVLNSNNIKNDNLQEYPKVEKTIEPKVEKIVESKVEKIVEPKFEKTVDLKVEKIVDPNVENVVEKPIDPKLNLKLNIDEKLEDVNLNIDTKNNIQRMENLQNENLENFDKKNNLNNMPEIKINFENSNKNFESSQKIPENQVKSENLADLNGNFKTEDSNHFGLHETNKDFVSNTDQLKNNQKAYENYIDQTKNTVDADQIYKEENNDFLLNNKQPVNIEAESTFSNFALDDNTHYKSPDANSKQLSLDEQFSSDSIKENTDEFSTQTNFAVEENNLLKTTKESKTDNFVNEKLVLEENTKDIFSNYEVDKKQLENENYYSYFLKYTLSFITDFLPESIVIFLERGLKISVNMIIMVFLVGILWIISFSVKFFFISIDNEKNLKNQLCGYQSKLFIMNKEKEELMKSLKSEKMIMTKDLEENRLTLENSLKDVISKNEELMKEILSLKKGLQEKDELFLKKEEKLKNLIEENLNLIEEKEKLNLDLNSVKELKNEFEVKLDQLESHNQSLKTEIQQNEEQIKFLAEEKDNLAIRLDENQSLIDEKEIKISCLNKMLEEFKDIEKITDDSGEEFTNLFDIAKLRCDLEKAEKEKDDLKESQDSIIKELNSVKKSLEVVANEKNNYEEEKAKLIKEKEDAEKYLDFLKKYYNENKIELQKELGVCQYKEKQMTEQNKELNEKVENLEKQLEEIKTEFQISKVNFEKTEKSLKEDLSTSSKAASDYWKEYQAIKTELFSVKKDAEFLRQQLRYPSASASQAQSGPIPPPPTIPKPLMDFFEQIGNLQLPQMTSNPNFLPTSSPINPPSIGQDIQNYHTSLSNMPFSVQQNQNLFNPIEPANNFGYPNPSLENIMPLDQEIYNPDFQYTSLPNISYASTTINQGFNPNVQQQNWETRNTYTPSNQENPNTSQSFQQF